jgi:hypothetical protein
LKFDKGSYSKEHEYAKKKQSVLQVNSEYIKKDFSQDGEKILLRKEKVSLFVDIDHSCVVLEVCERLLLSNAGFFLSMF